MIPSVNCAGGDQTHCSPPLINLGKLPIRTVRISLPPSPPPDLPMLQQSIGDINQTRRSRTTSDSLLQGVGRVVLPTDTVEDDGEHRFRSGSKWRQHDVALLKVKFTPDEDCELPMLDVEHDWSFSQCQRILSLLPMVVDRFF